MRRGQKQLVQSERSRCLAPGAEWVLAAWRYFADHCISVHDRVPSNSVNVWRFGFPGERGCVLDKRGVSKNIYFAMVGGTDVKCLAEGP